MSLIAAILDADGTPWIAEDSYFGDGEHAYETASSKMVIFWSYSAIGGVVGNQRIVDALQCSQDLGRERSLNVDAGIMRVELVPAIKRAVESAGAASSDSPCRVADVSILVAGHKYLGLMEENYQVLDGFRYMATGEGWPQAMACLHAFLDGENPPDGPGAVRILERVMRGSAAVCLSVRPPFRLYTLEQGFPVKRPWSS